jgi:hypothetical protein
MRSDDRPMTLKHWVAAALVLFLLAGLLLVPIRVPRTIEVPGKVLCAREWIVRMDAEGTLVSSLVDRVTGAVLRTTTQQYTRGDVVRCELSRKVTPGGLILQGDTVAFVRSNEIDRTLAELKGEVASAEALLASATSGQKEAVVQEAQQQLEQARRNEEALRVILARQKLLFEKGLISEQEYQVTERQATVSGIGVSIAEAHLRAVSTGDKREEQELMRTNIRRFRGQLDVLRERRAQGSLCAPIRGVVLCAGVNDTLVMVADTSAYVVLMPVPMRDAGYVTCQQRISLSGNEIGDLPSAVVGGTTSPVQNLGCQQVYMVTGICDRAGAAVLHGLLVRCAIHCPPCSLQDYLVALFSRTIR